MIHHFEILAEQILEVKEKDPARYERLILEGQNAELGYDTGPAAPKARSIEEIKAKHRPKEENFAAISDAVLAGNKKKVIELVETAIRNGKDPVLLVTNALMPGIQAQCELYDLGKAFVPEILISSGAMLEGIKLCQVKIGDVPSKGRVATFVVEGDLHDIGKNIVSAILRANGFDVVDLGRDVLAAEVVEAVRAQRLKLVSGSTLMSTTKGSLKTIAETLEHEKLNVPLAAGGSAVSKNYVETFDNAIYGKSPIDAVKIAQEVCAGKDWKEVRTSLR
jgi:methylated-thiol--corrinoid protein